MNQEYDYFDEDIMMVNPNLYVTLAASDQGGYLLREDGGLVFLENGDSLFT